MHSETVKPKRKGRKRDDSAPLELNRRVDALGGTATFTSDRGLPSVRVRQFVLQLQLSASRRRFFIFRTSSLLALVR